MKRVRLGEVYVALCVILAAIAIFPAEPPDLAYYGLMVVMLPVSVTAATVTYLGGILVFGLEMDSLLARGTIFGVWVALAVLQMLAARALLNTRKR